MYPSWIFTKYIQTTIYVLPIYIILCKTFQKQIYFIYKMKLKKVKNYAQQLTY